MHWLRERQLTANTVTITLKAGALIAAGTQTFYLRVLR